MARATDGNEQLCSFCGKSQRQVKKLIAGPGAYIDECIDLCNEIIDEELTSPAQLDLDNPRPEGDLFDPERLRRRSGRGEADAVGRGLQPLQARPDGERIPHEVELQKSNILLLGPTGAARRCSRRRSRASSTSRSRSPTRPRSPRRLRGEDVENILLKLIQAADFDKKAETGIIYIDEVDKIARKADNPSITRDVSGEGPAGALEDPRGTVASVPGGKHPHPGVPLDRHDEHPLHLRRRFAGLEKIIGKRIGKNQVGFGADIKSRRSVETMELSPGHAG